MVPPPPKRSGAAATQHRIAVALSDPTPTVRLLWMVLAGVPLLWVVEYTGPHALNLVLRGVWVALAVALVVMALWSALRPRRRAIGSDQDLSR